MKNNVMVIAAMMVSTIMLAQGNRSGSFRQQPQRNVVKNELGISEAQRTSMETVNKKYAAKQEEALKALRSQKEKEITALLTPEQKVKQEQIRKEGAERRVQFQARMVTEHDARMKSTLLLSDDQSTRLHQEDGAYRKKLQTLRNDQASQASNDEIKKVRIEHQTTVQGILNTEQFKKWNSLNTPGAYRNAGTDPGRNQFDHQRAFGNHSNQDQRRPSERNQRGPDRNHNQYYTPRKG